MSFCVAVQSAIFYIASCTPCHQARHHKRSIAKAKEAREAKDRIRAEYPDAYQHPDPFNTNPYWSEEIMMGPHIEKKEYKATRKNTSQRGLHSAGNDQVSTAGSTAAAGSPHLGSSPTVVAEDHTLSVTSTSISEDWNKKRYQREDEELWGHEFSRAGHRLMDAIKQAGSSAHRRIEASLGMEPKPVTDQDRATFYFAPKNPPVNDYHPPIVRQRPAHKDAHKWMLQPPPAAKVMEGKVPVSRTGSMASHLSRKTTTSESPALGRLVHERAMEAKLRNGESPSEHELIPSRSRPDSRRTNTGSTIHARQSWQSARSRSLSTASSDASEGRRRRKAKRRATLVATPDSETSEDDDVFYKLKSSDPNAKSTKVARRPKLRTITSSQASEECSTNNTTPLSPPGGGDSKTPRSAPASAPLGVIDGLPMPPPPSLQFSNQTSSSSSSKTTPTKTTADGTSSSSSPKLSPFTAARAKSEMPV
ncbi:hypothetical protein MGN70_014525 [Eutypa lata]|nr:hypothetical protein MGN70_014525 [Eutypa lata]